MSTLKANRVQLGQSGTATQNFTLDATAADGTMKLARGVAGGTTQDIMLINALGEIDFPQLVRSYGANGYQKLPGGLIVQWGKIPPAAVASGTAIDNTITFPIAFPNAVLCAFAAPFTTVSLSFLSATTFGWTLTGMHVAQGSSFSSSQQVGATWLAIGN